MKCYLMQKICLRCILFDCPLSTNADDECGNEYATDLRHNTGSDQTVERGGRYLLRTIQLSFLILSPLAGV